MKNPIVTACPDHRIRLAKVDPDDTGGWDKEEAVAQFVELRDEISGLQQMLYAENERSLLLVFQGLDTAGKDGSVKAVCTGLNPGGLLVHSFKQPSREELAHDFLWRAHKVTPGKGIIGIWNRSHYEDVLVVRVHKLVPKKVWKQRYEQINNFERMLSENGTTILKFFLHISKDEQKERLHARLADPTRRWKFNPEDLKERRYWEDYEEAYEDAINCCATAHAPWQVLPANHKWARNLAIAEQMVCTLKKMGPKYPKLLFDPKTVRID